MQATLHRPRPIPRDASRADAVRRERCSDVSPLHGAGPDPGQGRIRMLADHRAGQRRLDPLPCIGRTGRAERLGDAFTLVTQEDKATIRDIEKILGAPIKRRVLEGFNYNEQTEKTAVALPRSRSFNRVRPMRVAFA